MSDPRFSDPTIEAYLSELAEAGGGEFAIAVELLPDELGYHIALTTPGTGALVRAGAPSFGDALRKLYERFSEALVEDDEEDIEIE